MSGDSASQTDEVGQILVVWSGKWPEETVLHRKDDANSCSRKPKTNTDTDLVTAAVSDGNQLCSYCDWPEGAQEVLES